MAARSDDRSARRLPPDGDDRKDVKRPWSVPELNRLLATARHELGDIAGIPAGRWWSALLLTLLDTGSCPAGVLGAPLSAYDPAQGRVTLGRFTFELHFHTVAAFEAIRGIRRERLLPWPKDRGGTSFTMLIRDYRTLLYRAGLPQTKANLFDRMRVTARADDRVLDHINTRFAFQPRADKPTFPRAPRASEARPDRTRIKTQPIIAPAPPGAVTVLGFFDDSYRVVRMATSSAANVNTRRAELQRFDRWLKRQATMDDLSEDAIERFMASLLTERRSPATVNKYRRVLMALWSYAWKKRKGCSPPGDVPKLREPKRLPVAWSQEEMARLLEAAAETRGDVCGIPARVFWPALICTIYDTGLRITAAMSIPTARLNLATGWILATHDTQKQKADQAFKLHPETLKLLLLTGPHERETLFPWPFVDRRKTLVRALNGILIRAGLPHGARDKFHKIRRTHATYLADVAGEQAAQYSLGHSSASVTRGYLDPTKFRRRTETVDILERPAWTMPEFRTSTCSPLEKGPT